MKIKAQDIINEIEDEDIESKFSKKPMTNKLNKNLRYFLWTMIGIVLMIGLVFATTTITDLGINSPEVNGVLYVMAGNGSDIQAKIDLCPSTGCKVVVPSGDYALDNTINLTSDLTFEILQGASIYYNTGASPQRLTDAQAGVYNQMIYGNGLENIKIFNYGIIEPRKITNPANGEQAIHINNSRNIYIHGGHLKNSDSGYCIYNSQDIKIENIYSDSLNEAVWQECTNRTIINNINCIAGGFEGECIEMNGYSEYVTISNIIIEGGSQFNDQAIDLNANKYVTLNNIVGNNVYKLITSTTTAGIRFGSCNPIVGSDIIGNNLICNNCNLSSSRGTTNTSWSIFEEKELNFPIFKGDYSYKDRVLIGGNESTSFSARGAVLELTQEGTFPLLFLYPTGTISNPPTSSMIGFGEGKDAVLHSIYQNGSSNDLVFSSSVIGDQFSFNRDNPGLKIYSNSTTTTCNAGSEGTIYYDGDVNKHYGCDGSSWNAFY